MNTGDFIFTIVIFLVPLLIVGLLIYMFMSMKNRKNQLDEIKNALSEGVSKKQIK